jgi:surfeit locus 1 family protein
MPLLNHAPAISSQRSRGRRLLWPGIMTAAGVVILATLGWWQVQRLHWKTANLNRIAAAITAPPMNFRDWQVRQTASDPDDTARFRPGEFEHVTVTGRFEHGGETYVFAARNGAAGYLVFTPLVMENCGPAREPCSVLINRGFVPERLREPQARGQGQASGAVTVTGLTRWPETPHWFTPAPDPSNRVWYSTAFVDNAYIEADAAPNPGGWPRGRDPRELYAAIPNNHAQYAFTWFSLAAVLLGVYAVYARGQLRQR